MLYYYNALVCGYIHLLSSIWIVILAFDYIFVPRSSMLNYYNALECGYIDLFLNQ